MSANFLDQEFPDEEDEDDFNPQPEVGSDDEADAKPNVEADDDEDEPSSERPRARSAPKDEDDLKEEDGDGVNAADGEDEGEADGEEDPQGGDEEEDEEEDEDEEDEDEEQPSRKRRKRRRNQFIDVEAEVDEDDEEEPEEEDDMPGEEMHPDDLQELPPGADRDDRMHRELDRQRERQEAMDVEETAARLKERYGRQARAGGAGSAIVPQKLLMPGVNDPRIWRLKCRPGKEREIIFAIQHRIVERSKSREPVQIFSALERSGPMGGSIYVEAARQDDIMPALEGITHIFFGTKPQLIPVEEMPDLLRTRKTKQLEAGMYVRYKRGLYAGDLAQIEDIEPNGTEVELKVVPRLDYGLNEDANAPIVEQDGQGGGKRKRVQKPFSARPAARLFSENEAKKRHSKYLQSQGGLSRNAWTYQGKDYRDGFLLERVKISALQTENVNPTLEEVTRFAAGAEDGTENLDLAALAATLKTSAGADYLPGDKVEIFRGEQNGLIGRATEVYGEVVRIRVEDGPLRGQTVEAPKRDLRKLFKEGDHVKVIGGSKYQDEVGMVVKTKDNRVTILTDSTQTEISVFSKDLREATDSGGVVGASKYDLFDLVQLDASTVGCVIKVDRESLRVIDQLGNIKTLLPSNISNKIERRRDGGSAADRLGQEVKVGDAVKEYGGEGKCGPVLHIHRNFIFAQSRESRENAGVWVARCNNVEISAAKGGRVGTDLTKMNTALRGPNGGAPAPMPPPQQKGRDRLIGRTVRIRMGPQKGMIGIVKDATDDSATIELHAKNKKLPIRKDKLAVIDPTSGNVIAPDASMFGSGRPSGPPGRGGPMGGQTPGRGFGGPPPGAGGRTPAYLGGGGGGIGGRTPTWKQDSGARTPAYGGATSYGGGQTAYGGGQTAYGGGATSYGGGSVWGGGGGGGGMSTWNPNAGGGRTPAYLGGGSKTPAYTGMDAAPTPGFQDSAPTPGGNFDQPTPGAWKPGQYQTPAAYNTPGGFPETPGPYSAETPAAHDDGPRYD